MKTDKKDKQPPIPLKFRYKGEDFVGLARPLALNTDPETGNSFNIFLEENVNDTITKDVDGRWVMEGIGSGFAEKIGALIDAWH